MLDIRFDTGDLSRLNQRLSLLTEKNLRYAVANAMTAAGRQAQADLRQQTPRFVDNPTSWTLGGIPQRTFARPSDLTINLGFATERRGRGSPAGRYLNPLAAGTTPHLKGADLSAARIAGTPRAVLIPARTAGLTDGAGNVPLRRQADILARARSGPRSGVFIAPVRRGSSTMAIFERTDGFIGRTSTYQRSVRRLFTLDTTPSPRRRQFNVQDVVMDSFTRSWRREMAAAFDAELRRVMGK